MNNKNKAKVVTVALCAFILLVCADLVGIYPNALPWVLGVFAIPGAWWFCKTTFLWLTTEDKPIVIPIKRAKHRKPKTYADYAKEAEQ